MRKKFLVTGGCGFIGSHLVEFLLGAGHSVTIIDDLSSGSKKNLVDINEKFDFILAKVEDTNIADLGHFDGVFHLAAQASVPYSIKNFYASSSTNLLSSLKVIDYCSASCVPLIYASSSAVYGNLPIGKESEEVDLLSPYALDKLALEMYCNIAGRVYGLNSYGLRFYNVYGPRQDPSNPYSGVISIFIDRILNNNSITINGGFQTRDFIYVKDIVVGIWSSYIFLLDNPGPTYSNLLTGNSTTIDELAQLVMRLTGKTVKTTYLDLPKGDPKVSLGDMSIMTNQLKLQDFVSIESGLMQTIEWANANNEKS